MSLLLTSHAIHEDTDMNSIRDLAAKGHIANVQVRITYSFVWHLVSNELYSSAQKYGVR